MKQIRRSVFETNSSSTHSITISGLKDIYDFPTTDLPVRFGEYGWEYEHYYDIEDKLSYVFTMMQYKIGAKYDWGNKRLLKSVIESDYSKWIQEMTMEHCGKKLIFSSKGCKEDESFPCGYIDHQSTDVLDDFWSNDEKEFKELMKEFIFNSKYGFMTDNDNH